MVDHILGIVTSVRIAPILWLIACAAIIVSYARKPAPSDCGQPDPDGSSDPADNDSVRMAVPTTES